MHLSVKLATLLGAVALTATPALAAPDHKTYPGLECVSDTAVINYSLGRAFNTGTGANLADIFHCPVIRDLTPTAGIESARVWVVDQNAQPAAANNVSCTLFTRSSPTFAVHDFETRSTVGSSPVPEPLSFALFATPASPVIAGDADDYYYLQCSVPTITNAVAQSGIVSYEINERP